MGGTLRTPASVASRIDHTEPMMTMKNIAVSVWPNHSNASGAQQTLGRVCSPSASKPTVSSENLNREFNKPKGNPSARPTAYPNNRRLIVIQLAPHDECSLKFTR